MKTELLVMSAVRVIAMACIAMGISHRSLAGDGDGGLAAEAPSGQPESSGSSRIAPPRFARGVGAGAQTYERMCSKPAVEKNYEKCVIKNDLASREIGEAISIPDGSSPEGIQEQSTAGSDRAAVARDVNIRAGQICVSEGRACVEGCKKAGKTLLGEYQAKVSCGAQSPECPKAAEEIRANMRRAKDGEKECKEYFEAIVSQYTGSIASLDSAGAQYGNVRDATGSSGTGAGRGGAHSEGGGPSKFDQLGGGSDSPTPKDSSGGSSMSPWLVGGIGAAVGGIAGYMFGKNTGEEEGYEAGKKDAEEAARKEEEDADGDGSADCAKAESATKTECKGTFYAKCDKDPTAEGCSDFSDSYCKTTDPVPDAAFCRKMSAANYCSKSDSINKGNCMSCREISSGFTGQYSPEDLANSCALCSGDPLCSTGGSYFAYRAAVGNTTLAGGNSLSPNLPGTAGAGSGGGSGSSVGGVSTGSGGAGTGGSGPFGQSLTGGGSLAGGTMQVQNSGANQYRISSSHGQSNFRVHSSVIQRFCQQGSMVGCGPLVGVSGGRGVSSSPSEGESLTGVGAQ
ncbi:MAG: hypothetical protein IPL83_04550 [Bdellovibrionales bacterium]|nr:hypothetical protein [Bdellovibrionales bacterium]